MAVEAVGQKDCSMYGEDTVTDEEGKFRLRGLLVSSGRAVPGSWVLQTAGGPRGGSGSSRSLSRLATCFSSGQRWVGLRGRVRLRTRVWWELGLASSGHGCVGLSDQGLMGPGEKCEWPRMAGCPAGRREDRGGPSPCEGDSPDTAQLPQPRLQFLKEKSGLRFSVSLVFDVSGE